MVTVSLLTGIYLKFGKRSHAWASRTPNAQPQKEAPMLALLLPIVPVVLKIALDFSVIGGFIIAGFAALFLCGRMKGSFKENCQLVNKLYYDGVVDTAPLIGFLLTLPMFNTLSLIHIWSPHPWSPAEGSSSQDPWWFPKAVPHPSLPNLCNAGSCCWYRGRSPS